MTCFDLVLLNSKMGDLLLRKAQRFHKKVPAGQSNVFFLFSIYQFIYTEIFFCYINANCSILSNILTKFS